MSTILNPTRESRGGGRPTIYGEETVRTSVRIPKTLIDIIRQVAQETQKNASTVIVEALVDKFG